MTSSDPSRKLDMRTVVLVGGRDFGRCPLAARVPAALWPVVDQPVLRRLLDHLAGQGIAEAIVCCGKDVHAAVEAVCAGSRLKATLVVEELTSGTAGCLRDAVASDPGDLLLVLSASMVAPPSIAGLIEAHQAHNAELTAVFNPGAGREAPLGSPAEIYLCQPQMLKHIPTGGYADIKEGLIPSVLRVGGRVCPVVLDLPVGNFRDRRGYLEALAVFFRSHAGSEGDDTTCESSGRGPVLKGIDVSVHPTARLCGPVAIADHTRIREGAVVVGPAMIGENAVLSEYAAVIRSALWADARAGARCEIRESIVGWGMAVPDGTVVVEQAISADSPNRERSRQQTRRAHRAVQGGGRTPSWLDRALEKWRTWAPRPSRELGYLGGSVLILLAFLWSYWSTVTSLVEAWSGSDEYSSGLLVPPLAAYIIWSRRRDIAAVRLAPALFWGVVAFLAAQAIRGAGLCFMYQSAERLSLVLSLAALVLLLMGWQRLIKLTPILLFLCLMLPWPNRVQSTITLPLQRWATSSAVFCLEVAGYEVLRDGNIIHIGQASVAVAEACNGLRMITAFFVISGLVVLLVKRTWWEKLIVLLSSLPIALLCNTLRLAVTAVMFTVLEGEEVEQGFHDGGGYAMMPLALALVVGELWLLARLTTPPMETKPAIISRRPAQHVPDS